MTTPEAARMLLDQAVEEAKRTPFVVTDEYMRLVREMENAPWNNPGTDKSWVYKLVERDERHFARARRVIWWTPLRTSPSLC